MTTVLVWLLVVHLVNNNRFRKLYILSFFVYEFLFSAHFDHPYSHHLYTSLCHSLFLTKTSSLIIHTFAFPSFIRTPQPSPSCFPPPTNPPLSSQNYASELYWLNQCCKLFLIEQRARIVNVKRFYPLYLSFGSIVNTPLSSHYVSHTNTQKKNKAVNNSFSSHQQTNKQGVTSARWLQCGRCAWRLAARSFELAYFEVSSPLNLANVNSLV